MTRRLDSRLQPDPPGLKVRDMAAFLSLPAEVNIHILKSLRIHDIHSFQLLCKATNQMVVDNCSTIYRQAAVLHQYVRRTEETCGLDEIVKHQDTLFNEAGSEGPPISDWRQYCRMRWRIDTSWTKAIIPNQTSVRPVFDDAFTRLCVHNSQFLMPSESDNTGFYTWDRHSSIKEYGEVRTGAIFTSTNSSLELCSGNFFLFKAQSKTYEMWWRDTNKLIKNAVGNEPIAFLNSMSQDDDSSDVTSENQRGFDPLELRCIGKINLEARCDVMQMKDGILMLVTEHNILHVFDLATLLPAGISPFETDEGKEPIQLLSRRALHPASTFDINHTPSPESPDTDGLSAESATWRTTTYTLSIDFNEEHIFHGTDHSLRILDRATGKALYTLSSAPLRKVAPGRWARSISPNTFAVPPVVVPSSLTNNLRRIQIPAQPHVGGHGGTFPVGAGFGAVEVGQLWRPTHNIDGTLTNLGNEVVPVERGVAPFRKDRPWRWDICATSVHEDGLFVLALRHGFIVVFPDYRRLLVPELGGWRLEDPRACWVLDLGAKDCGGMVCDGRRIVCAIPKYLLIINIHEMQYDDGVNTGDNVINAGAPVVRIPVSANDGWGWGSIVGSLSGAGAQNMVLTERSLWALVKNSSAWETQTILSRWDWASLT